MDLSIVPEHSFCVLRGLGQRPNKHETGGSRVDGIRLFSQSGYRFALLAAFLPPVRTPVFPPLPILQSGRGVLARFSEKCLARSEKKSDFFNPFPKKIQGIHTKTLNCGGVYGKLIVSNYTPLPRR